MGYKNRQIIKTYLSHFDQDVILIAIENSDHVFVVHTLGERPVSFQTMSEAVFFAEEKLQIFYK